jgi:hypothetical protein
LLSFFPPRDGKIGACKASTLDIAGILEHLMVSEVEKRDIFVVDRDRPAKETLSEMMLRLLAEYAVAKVAGPQLLYNPSVFGLNFFSVLTLSVLSPVILHSAL